MDAKLNVTWDGQNGDLPDMVDYDSTTAELLQLAEEAVTTGGIPGIDADPGADFDDFIVDRFPANEAEGLPARLMVRPKTPFGG